MPTLLYILAAIALLPMAVFILECLAALLPAPRAKKLDPDRPIPLAVLVPAHNEQDSIEDTIKSILPQLMPHDRLLVVADNCSDQTAHAARSAGASAVERQNPTLRGKGYALAFGLDQLKDDPPEVVIVIDADTHVHVGTIHALARTVAATGRPAQAVNLLNPPPDPKPRDAISALAFAVKNLVRARGLLRLGLPCPLMGTGMAFPWQATRLATLGSDNIVEDMQFGLDLLLAGLKPTLCLDARVTGTLPSQASASLAQRRRWEHGHLRTILTQTPRLLAAALRQRRPDLLFTILDLSVPPLSLLVLLWTAALAATAAAARLLAAPAGPALLLLGGGIAMAAVLVLVWARFCRQTIALSALMAVPFYLLWKFPLYFRFLFKPEKKWVRTER